MLDIEYYCMLLTRQLSDPAGRSAVLRGITDTGEDRPDEAGGGKEGHRLGHQHIPDEFHLSGITN